MLTCVALWAEASVVACNRATAITAIASKPNQALFNAATIADLSRNGNPGGRSVTRQVAEGGNLAGAEIDDERAGTTVDEQLRCVGRPGYCRVVSADLCDEPRLTAFQSDHPDVPWQSMREGDRRAQPADQRLASGRRCYRCQEGDLIAARRKARVSDVREPAGRDQLTPI